jgi:tRNA G18 (ribose-2'-O)-methylase SpoU
MRKIILIVHDVRSSLNVGAILRTAEGLGVEKVYMTGYTPYPSSKNDSRLPYLSDKINRRIEKTALGASSYINWEHISDIHLLITDLKRQKFQIIALEQNSKSIPLNEFIPSDKVAIILGNEVEGIDDDLINISDKIVEIPMFGKKESFNVASSAAMIIYHCRFSVK